MIIKPKYPIVILSARTAAWLERYARLHQVRVQIRGTDPAISQELEEIRHAAMAWRSSATGTAEDVKPEPAQDSEQWFGTGRAAEIAGVTPRAITKAIADSRLAATQVDGRYRISREDLEHWKQARKGAIK